MTTQPLEVQRTGTARSWEYTTADLTKPKRDIEVLNRLGADGWEAVAMVTTWGVSEMRFAHPVVLLKRPVASIST
jgi:hypothetical protein